MCWRGIRKIKMMNEFPVAVILLDYVLGAAMWTLIGRFGMSIFVSEHSDFFFMRAFVKFTDPMIKAMAMLHQRQYECRTHPKLNLSFLYEHSLPVAW